GHEGAAIAGSFFPVITPDGRYVFFACTAATSLAPGVDVTDELQVFRLDRSTGQIIIASTTGTGTSDGPCGFGVAASSNGDAVAFGGEANNIVIGDTNSLPDVFVHDITPGSTQVVSVGPGNVPGNALAADPSLSADGTLVAYASD